MRFKGSAVTNEQAQARGIVPVPAQVDEVARAAAEYELSATARAPRLGLVDQHVERKGGGIRIGTPAVTSRGMKEEDMMEIADQIHRALEARDNPAELAKIREDVRRFTSKYPLPG